LRFSCRNKIKQKGEVRPNGVLKPRGADGGPKRTPPHLGDDWQHKPSDEVKEVISCFDLLLN